ncbi:MAG: hypothetical protein KF900_04885 [Bacteroidetes bacterium]|nr:hypothetical protein [Bacteroidota bacterium]
MKRTIIKLFSAAIITSTFFSCSEAKKEVTAPQGMNVLNLSRYGKPFSIFVPDTNAGHFEVIEQTSGALDIIAGNNFAISINEQFADLELRKSDIKDDEVNKLKSYIIEEPDAILWESQITEPEFHFLVNKKIGTSEYSFEDIRNPEAKPFALEATQRMFDSSKNISENK